MKFSVAPIYTFKRLFKKLRLDLRPIAKVGLIGTSAYLPNAAAPSNSARVTKELEGRIARMVGVEGKEKEKGRFEYF